MNNINVDALLGFWEPVSSLSHLLAVPVFAVAGYFLVKKGCGDWKRTVSLLAMALTTVFLLSMSGVYHLLGPGAGRDVMKQLDIAGVFALIAGTITPVHAILFRGISRWAPLVLVWSAAIVGIVLRTIASDRISPDFANAIFLILGWTGLPSFFILWRRYDFDFVGPLLSGGLAYTVGVVVLSLNRPVLIPGVFGAHELWHLAVLIGLGLHWQFVFQFAGGAPVIGDSKRRPLFW